MAKPIREALNELLAILWEIDATVAWQRYEQKEHPGGVTPMGVLPDDTRERIDTLCGQFFMLFIDTKRALKKRRPRGASVEDSRKWLHWMDDMGKMYWRLCPACFGRASRDLR